MTQPFPPVRGYMYYAQAATTKLLDIFNKVCDDNGLKYWLGAGNLLGIVRHNGIPIPWDDDIDVYMLRPDYEKAMELLPKIFNDSRFRLVFRGFSLKFVRYKNFQLSFDIFPIDQYFQRLETEKEIKKLFNLIDKQCKFIPSRKQWLKLTDYIDEQEWFNNMWYEDEASLFPEKLLKKYLKVKKQWDSTIMCNKDPAIDGLLLKGFERICWANAPRYTWDYNWIFPLKKTEYNGIQTYIPNNPDLYLNSQYGDYYALPPDFHLHTAKLKLPSSAIASANELISLDVENFIKGRKKT
jgi:lipopolysaccharide cholinephosphotransferase